MRVHAINAAEGDCLLLESDSQFALVDGGISGIYEDHLYPYLLDVLGLGQSLSAVIVSHVDQDHITGILALLADIERANADDESYPFKIADLWHNSFASTLDTADKSLSGSLHAMVSQAGRANVAAANSATALLSIAQGARLRRMATKLRIPLNEHFAGERITQESAIDTLWQLGEARFAIAGPTEDNLRRLQKDWIKWIESNVDTFAIGDVQAMANADLKAPNLSSIVLLGTTPHGDVLLTGDARGDHILQGLEQAGLMEPHEIRPLRLLKIQHHGSNRNIAADFVRRLPADIYLFSANGKHGNPDQDVLALVVDIAKADGRKPLIVATNETPSLDWLRQHRPQGQFDYELVVRDPANHAVVIDLETRSAS